MRKKNYFFISLGNCKVENCHIPFSNWNEEVIDKKVKLVGSKKNLQLTFFFFFSSIKCVRQHLSSTALRLLA